MFQNHWRGALATPTLILGLSMPADRRRTRSGRPGLQVARSDQVERAARRPARRTPSWSGDPSKPGLYVVLNRWLKGNHFSRPHSHPNDRFITRA